MRINDVLLESTIKNDPIFESAYRGSKLLAELKLSNDQITKVFQAVADGAAKGQNDGSNRTVLGKGADAVTSVSQAFDKVKDKISKSGPVSGFDAAFDKMQTQILDAAGGDAGAVGKAIDSYREFAQKHPIMQGAIYGGLIALAGISGAGLGGAALLGGIKLFDRLLQGDKASSALWKGFKTGAIAYGASKLGDFIRGDKAAAPQSTNSAGTPNPTDDATRLMPTSDFEEVSPKLANYVVSKYPPESFEYRNDGMNLWIYNKETGAKQAMFDLMNDSVYRQERPLSEGQVYLLLRKISQHEQLTEGTNLNKSQLAEVFASPAIVEYIDRKHTVWTWALNESLNRAHGGVMLTTAGVAKVFESIVNEGPFTDKIKSAAGKVAGAVGGAVKRGWEDASNKVTYNKLDLNWRRGEGRDQTGLVDSDVLAGFLRKQGVVDGLIANVYKSMKIPFNPNAGTDTTSASNIASSRPQGGGKIAGQTSQTPTAVQKRQQRSAGPASQTTQQSAAPTPQSTGLASPNVTYKDVKQAVTKLAPAAQVRLKNYLEVAITKHQSSKTKKLSAKKKSVQTSGLNKEGTVIKEGFSIYRKQQ